MLPRPDGPYDVGLTTLAFQVPKKVVGNRSFKANGNPALVLQEVAFALYYPSASRTAKDSSYGSKRVHGVKPGVVWLQKCVLLCPSTKTLLTRPIYFRPLRLALAGWAHFLQFSSVLLWPVVHLYAMLLSVGSPRFNVVLICNSTEHVHQVPAYPNVPLLSPNSKSGNAEASSASSSSTLQGEHESSKSKWPFIIFSHGLGGSRTAYSHYCSQLASEGNVVLALEHHDGTCVYTTVRKNGLSNKKNDLIGLKYINPDDVAYVITKILTRHSSFLRAALFRVQIRMRRRKINRQCSSE